MSDDIIFSCLYKKLTFDMFGRNWDISFRTKNGKPYIHLNIAVSKKKPQFLIFLDIDDLKFILRNWNSRKPVIESNINDHFIKITNKYGKIRCTSIKMELITKKNFTFVFESPFKHFDTFIKLLSCYIIAHMENVQIKNNRIKQYIDGSEWNGIMRF